MKSKRFAIIVAGGSGKRMNLDYPKQFLKICDKPVIIHTLERFIDVLPSKNIVIVIPENHLSLWEEVKASYFSGTDFVIAFGGRTRFQSVKSGLDKIDSTDGIVAIHDAVRPCISNKIIEASFNVAEKTGSAITSVALRDSIREIEKAGSVSRDRTKYRLIQTPQAFRLSILREAYSQKESVLFTDDATVAESKGFKINLIEGSYKNIKITTQEDLTAAKYFLEHT